MKSSNSGSVKISQQKGIWSTTPSNEARLSKAFMEDHLVILIFSVQGSGHFQVPNPELHVSVQYQHPHMLKCVFLQGYARMTSAISQESCRDWDVLGLGGVFCVEWIQKESMPFHCTQHILNPWNDGKKVQISRDGQVRACGTSFCQSRAPAGTLCLRDRRSLSYLCFLFVIRSKKKETCV